MTRSFLNGRVTVKVGDITLEAVDAIVNAANHTLLGGGGVDGAIHRAGGPQILSECRLIRDTAYPKGLPTGQAVITTGGNLPAKHVIHTVGPVYGLNNGGDADLLGSCYSNCLDLAAGAGLQSIAFPSISTGAFHYPRHEAARVSSAAIAARLDTSTDLTEVRLVFFSHADADSFAKHCSF